MGPNPDVRTVVLFEPWGLGDLAIALGAVQALRSRGCKVAIVCHPDWVEWVLGSGRADWVVGFHAPWTDKTAKYQVDKYRASDFFALRQHLKEIEPDVLCELRGDVRNLLMLKSLGLCRVVTLVGGRFANRYERPPAILEKLAIDPALPVRPSPIRQPANRQDKWHIVAFFSAAWENRAVPAAMAQEVTSAILRAGIRISVIIPDQGSLASWYPLPLPGTEQANVIRGSVVDACRAISEADACVSTDSGFLHVAHLYGLPVFGLFGFATEDEWAPPGCTIIRPAKCFPAESRYAKAGEELNPLEGLDPELVASTVLRGLHEYRASQHPSP
jgi:ADP-heptose:LPS heptosyltransferase